MREQHHHRSTFAAHFIDRFLHLRFLDAETPFRRKVARVGDRRVGKRLANNCHRHAIHFFHHVRCKYQVTEIGGLNVLRDEINLALEICLDNFLDALVAQGKFPVTGHHIDAELKRRIHHVLSLGPQCRCRALPGIAPVEQQRTRTTRLQLLHQRGEVRKATDLAVFACGPVKIEIGECMRFGAIRLNTEMFQ